MTALQERLAMCSELAKHERITKEMGRAFLRSQPWFIENSHALAAAGWTVERLYQIGILPYPYSAWGPGWLSLWNNEKSEVRLSEEGNIEFVVHEAGGDVVQTCFAREHFLEQPEEG